MIQVNEKEWLIIKSILSRYPHQFYAYGSRVKGRAKKYSDLDLCYKEEIPDSVISEIEEAFENSDLPYRVEFTAWYRCDPSFQNAISKDLTLLDFK